MSATSKNVRSATPKPAGRRTAATRIHPVVIYPVRHPADASHLEALYEMVARLDGRKGTYARPITVVDRKTDRAMAESAEYREFREQTVGRHSDILGAWCVDTCQMWYTGLGAAFERGAGEDVYWLIPGDFNYATPAGQEVLGRLHDLPEIIAELDQDLCIGEITTDHNHPKQLIDTYGTFALLYTWFPAEAREIRQYTERPRSEFLAVRHGFLDQALQRRWYPYEQTVVMLLEAVLARAKISRFSVGEITDLPEGRESLASAIVQVERTERVLKSFWSERRRAEPGWAAEYRALELLSERARNSALTILQNLLS